jgi:hypothetical protein
MLADMYELWNRERFDGLASLSSQLGTDPRLEHLASYCDLREKGLRPQALKVLNAFLKQSQSWDRLTQRGIVLFILDAVWSNPKVYGFLSHPLKHGFLEPVLKEWCASEPANPVPIRYYALLRNDYKLLKEALRMNSQDDRIRTAIVAMVITGVNYETHELPYGYIGDPAEGLDALLEAYTIIEGMTDSSRKTSLKKAVEHLSLLIVDWQQYQESPEGTFKDWCIARNHFHNQLFTANEIEALRSRSHSE